MPRSYLYTEGNKAAGNALTAVAKLTQTLPKQAPDALCLLTSCSKRCEAVQTQRFTHRLPNKGHASADEAISMHDGLVHLSSATVKYRPSYILHMPASGQAAVLFTVLIISLTHL